MKPFIMEPASEYHAKRADYLTSSSLKVFLKCPRNFRDIEDGVADPMATTPAMELGTAAHTLILEGLDALNAEYEIGGPINERTGKPYGKETKAYAAWTDAHGKKCLTRAQWETLTSMQMSITWHSVSTGLLGRRAITEGVLRGEVQGIPCQARCDAVGTDDGLIDLKTTGRPLEEFARMAQQMGYVRQLAFYSMLAKCCGFEFTTFYIIAVETMAPYRCGVFRATPREIETAMLEVGKGLKELIKCRETGIWPTRFEEVKRLFLA